jgi:hypothetical protein
MSRSLETLQMTPDRRGGAWAVQKPRKATAIVKEVLTLSLTRMEGTTRTPRSNPTTPKKRARKGKMTTVRASHVSAVQAIALDSRQPLALA